MTHCDKRETELLMSNVMQILKANNESDIVNSVENGIYPSNKKRRIQGGGGKTEIVNALAGILAACTLVGGGALVWCSYETMISAYMMSYLQPRQAKCASNLTIFGFNTGLGSRGLASAFSMLSGDNACKKIDQQYDDAAIYTTTFMQHLFASFSLLGLKSYSQLKQYYVIILTACAEAYPKVQNTFMTAKSSMFERFIFNAKKPDPGQKPPEKTFVNAVVEEIHTLIASETLEPIVLNALAKTEEIVEKEASSQPIETLVEPVLSREASATFKREASATLSREASPTLSREASPMPIISEASPSRRVITTPELEDLQPNSAEPTPIPEEFLNQGGRKNRKTMKRNKQRKTKNKKRKTKGKKTHKH